MSLPPRTVATVYFDIGQSKYHLGRYSDALKDFQRVEDYDLEGAKHNNIGLCYYQLGLFDEAEREYILAIKSNPKVVEAYHNLGVLYIDETKVARGETMIKSALKVNRNFGASREALKKLEYSAKEDWFNWWFDDGIVKRIVGGILIASVLGLSITSAYISLDGRQPSALAAIVGLLIAMLVLPNLSKLKVVDIELEVIPVGGKGIKIEPVLAGRPSSPITEPPSV